jgi:hypothetical protein
MVLLSLLKTHLKVFNDDNIRHKIEHILFTTPKWHSNEISKIWYAWSKYVT